MADNQSTQSKTEPATPHRLRELRRKGQVPKSRDLPAMASVIVAVLLMALMGAHVVKGLLALLGTAVSTEALSLGSAAALTGWMHHCFQSWLLYTVPFVVVVASVGLLSAFLSTGPVFSFEPVKPDINKINPVQGMKKMFSVANWVELIKLTFKFLLLCVVVWAVSRHYLPQLLWVNYASPAAIAAIAAAVLLGGAWAVVAAFMGPTLFDVWFQHWNFKRENRMTKDEVRREYRENEGDPHIRGKRRALHKEVNNANMLEATRKSSVVIVNPTHVAIALRYQPGETDLPVVVAKGEDDMAAEIRRIAEEEKIPILRDVSLARRLLERAPVDQYIPEEFIEPIAVVLRWIRDMGAPVSERGGTTVASTTELSARIDPSTHE